MSKAVVFARPIQPDWLDKTVEVYLEIQDHHEIKDRINTYLAGFIASPTNLRKTREILLRTWVDIDASLNEARSLGLKAFQSCLASERLSIHWGMLLLVFPIFRDICLTIGKLSDIQDEITLSQISRRIFELWGERTTLMHSLPKNMQTLRQFGVVSSNKPGSYVIKKKRLQNPEAIRFLVYAAMHAGGKLYYNLTEISRFKELFPFEFEIGLDELYKQKIFKVDRFGGEVVVSI